MFNTASPLLYLWQVVTACFVSQAMPIWILYWWQVLYMDWKVVELDYLVVTVWVVINCLGIDAYTLHNTQTHTHSGRYLIFNIAWYLALEQMHMWYVTHIHTRTHTQHTCTHTPQFQNGTEILLNWCRFYMLINFINCFWTFALLELHEKW